MTNTPLNILVVDDTAVWRELMRSILESELGTPPLVASGGREALGILNSRSIDVVVTDLSMPEMSGIDLMEKSRRRFPATKFMIVTADSVSNVVVSECISRGALAVVPKHEIEPLLVELLKDMRKPG